MFPKANLSFNAPAKPKCRSLRIRRNLTGFVFPKDSSEASHEVSNPGSDGCLVKGRQTEEQAAWLRLSPIA